MFTVYILYSRKYGKTYTGFTSDLGQRLLSHSGLSKKGCTVRYRPWEVGHTKTFEDKSEAMKREKHLKTGKGGEEASGIIARWLQRQA